MPRYKSDRVTLRDIAEQVDVSVMTVSRALSGRDNLVRPETARRIRRAAAELGYVPNLAARSLRGEQLPTLAMFAEYISSHHYLAELVDRTARAIEARKFGVICCQSVTGLVQALQEYHLSGAVIIAPPESLLYDETGHPAPPIPVRTPIVLLHSAIEQAIYHEVSPDIEQMAYLAADHLLDLGHRHLGWLGGPAPELEPHWFSLRRAGLTRAFRGRGLSHQSIAFQPCADVELAEGALQQLVRRSPPVTGVLCINDELAVAAAAGAARLGMRVPLDVSIVGSNDVRWARYFSPRPTTIRIDVRALVESGLNLLFDALHGRLPEADSGRMKIKLAPELILGESTGPPPPPTPHPLDSAAL
jgi:DNA-binding LacI/PurR family transcriptional regulator